MTIFEKWQKNPEHLTDNEVIQLSSQLARLAGIARDLGPAFHMAEVAGASHWLSLRGMADARGLRFRYAAFHAFP